MFAGCNHCGAKPTQAGELSDSLLLSRFSATEEQLAQAISERSPKVLIQAASAATREAAATALEDEQLRNLLQLNTEPMAQVRPKKERVAEVFDQLLRSTEAECTQYRDFGLEQCLLQSDSVSPWVSNERLLTALHGDAHSVSADALVEAIIDVAEKSQSIGRAELQRHLRECGASSASLQTDELNDLERAYDKSLLNRVVVSLERVSTEHLIALFTRLSAAQERRRDKQVLPLLKELSRVYKTHAMSVLRHEASNAGRLMSAIRTSSTAELEFSGVLLTTLESLLDNWQKVARPLTKDPVDQDVAGIRRALQSELQDIADYLLEHRSEDSLSARASQLALVLM